MSKSITVESLPSVRAQINYLVPMVAKPTTYVCDPPAGVPKHNARYEPQESIVRDGRPLRTNLSLEREGFVLADHVSAAGDFWNDERVLSVYYPELVHLIKRLSGAKAAFVFDHTRRRRTKDRAPLDGNRLTFSEVREPVGKAHTDFTPRSALARLELEMGERASSLKGSRFAIVNVWRPLNEQPIEDAPLAVLDASSYEDAELVASDLVYSDRVGETYNLKYGTSHRWFYFPKQSREEVVVFKNFDSDSPASFAPHTAFDDPGASPDAALRESIEARVFAFF